MHKRIVIAAAVALVSCGGSRWVDPTTGSFSAQDSAEVMTMLSGGMTAMASQPAQQIPLQNSRALTQSVSLQVTCAVSGNVTVNGSSDSSCSGNTCTANATLSMVLNACRTQNGLIGSGQLDVGAGGTQTTNGSVTTFNVQEHIQGGITVTRASDGSTVGTCGIYLDATVSYDGTTQTVHVSGTVCKQAVAQ